MHIGPIKPFWHALQEVHKHVMVQDYLASGRKGGQMGQTAGLPYRFCFFLYQQDASPNEQGLEASAAEPYHGASPNA